MHFLRSMKLKSWLMSFDKECCCMVLKHIPHRAQTRIHTHFVMMRVGTNFGNQIFQPGTPIKVLLYFAYNKVGIRLRW